MKRPNRHVKNPGYRMDDREPPKRHRHCQHGFVPAEQYVREQPLTHSLHMLSIQHSLDCRDWRRQYSLEETMIAILTLNKLRPKPNLKTRQEMEAITQ
jgi:hypothetical protein